MTAKQKKAELQKEVAELMRNGMSYSLAFANTTARHPEWVEGEVPLMPSEQRIQKVRASGGFANTRPAATAEFLNAKQIEASRKFREAVAEVQRQYTSASWDACWRIACGRHPELVRDMGEPSRVPKRKPSGALLPA